MSHPKLPIRLHAWPAASDLPSSSPFCLKVLGALNYKSLPHSVEIRRFGLPRWARKGTLPVAEIGDNRFEDSTHILKKLDELFPDTPRVYPEDPALRAETIILEDWADEWFVHFVAYYRWIPDHHWKRFSADLFSSYPLLVRKAVVPRLRKDYIRNLMGRSIGVDTEAERIARFQEAVWITEQKLSRNRYLITSTPTAADFAFHSIFRIIQADGVHELTPHFEKSGLITAWMREMDWFLRVN